MGQFHEMFQSNSEPFGLLLGAGVMFVVGALDDLIDVSPPAKVAGQVLAASLLALFGVTMFYFRMPFNLFHTDTVVLALRPRAARHRAVGRADDERGQPDRRARRARRRHRRDRAAARCSCSPTACSSRATSTARNIGPLVAIIAVGVCLGFLPFNWHPVEDHHGRRGRAVPRRAARGADDHDRRAHRPRVLRQHVLLLRARCSSRCSSSACRSSTRCSRSCAGSWRRQRWHQADAGHLHHRLMRLGHGPRRTVVILWAWTALLSAVALVPTYTNEGNALVPFVRRRPRARCCFAVVPPRASGAPGASARSRPRHPAGPPGADDGRRPRPSAAANEREPRSGAGSPAISHGSAGKIRLSV